MSSDNKEAYSFGNFKHKFTFTQVILYFFFHRLKELTFKKYFYVSSSVIGLSPLKQEFNKSKWTIIELNMTWLTVRSNRNLKNALKNK